MALAAHHSSDTPERRVASRGDLTAFLMQLADGIGADNYMLVSVTHSGARSDARILASNWIFDAIELVGTRLLATLAQSPFTAAPGHRPMAIVASEAPALAGIDGEEAKLLDVLGHTEIYSLRLDVGRQRLFMLFSATQKGKIDHSALTRAQLKTCYVLSRTPQILAGNDMQDPLSERERECLFWVSEGKTTEEIAVILGVSANTINSYITHAMQKLSASNRAMAIATAVRSGII
ncbi:helix-turn-helix transcriptional regulator [Mesorhizobium sp. SP-1A]|uniref:helix-turn-helix transcriptional regulator n=1 Tax=Mesorhizobium sp. SP-1A TaxID=3077840 RepID=UPI0028F72AD7|nr:LuxR C-terminal-related transcriptional regulator [Mesorhizobium sp. SP-1A]